MKNLKKILDIVLMYITVVNRCINFSVTSGSPWLNASYWLKMFEWCLGKEIH